MSTSGLSLHSKNKDIANNLFVFVSWHVRALNPGLPVISLIVAHFNLFVASGSDV
jgi:hypothetical protein